MAFIKDRWLVQFTNEYYKKEWKEITPFTRKPYKVGTIVQRNDGIFVVYDGAHNYMGTFDEQGKIKFNGKESEYAKTFLDSAVEFAKKQGKIK